MEPSVGEKKPQTAAYVQILSAAFLWGLIGLWNRALMAEGVSPISIVAIRSIGGALLLSAIFAVKDRSMFRVERAHLKYFFGTGVISVVLFTICYFSCQQLCSLAVASILLYTAPSFVVLMAALLWKEPVTKRKLLALLLTLVGCALVCGVVGGDLAITLPGLLLGLGAGFFYALYSIFGRYALRYYSPLKCTVWMFLFSAGASLFLLRPHEWALLLDVKLGLIAAALVVVSTVAPFLLYTTGLARVESGKASIIASVEPVVAALLGAVAFGEPITAVTAAGIALVLSGVYILR